MAFDISTEAKRSLEVLLVLRKYVAKEALSLFYARKLPLSVRRRMYLAQSADTTNEAVARLTVAHVCYQLESAPIDVHAHSGDRRALADTYCSAVVNHTIIFAYVFQLHVW